jgi:hypothetical protein
MPPLPLAPADTADSGLKKAPITEARLACSAENKQTDKHKVKGLNFKCGEKSKNTNKHKFKVLISNVERKTDIQK